MLTRMGCRLRKICVMTLLGAVSLPMCARASPLQNYMPDSWMGVYANLFPWIRRLSVLFIITGAVKMMEGYGKKGADGITKGAVYMIAGGILYALYV